MPGFMTSVLHQSPKKPMKKLISLLAMTFALFGCATQNIPQKKINEEKITAIKNVEIFYHEDSHAVIVQQSGGLLALASLGEADRIERRTKAFTAAIEENFPEKDMNLSFAKALSEKLEQRGITVKMTKINRPVGNVNMVKTTQFLNAPKTPGYAPLVFRFTTQFVAPSFMQGFRSATDVSFILLNEDGKTELVNTWEEHPGEETYSSFDDLLAANKVAYEKQKTDLLSVVPKVYGDIFIETAKQ
jgi:hypothetical protein